MLGLYGSIASSRQKAQRRISNLLGTNGAILVGLYVLLAVSLPESVAFLLLFNLRSLLLLVLVFLVVSRAWCRGAVLKRLS